VTDDVVIGSKGGVPTHAAWYVNLKANPECEIRVGARRMRAARAPRTATNEERLGQDGGDVSARRCLRETS
jgi:hypothetical protein